MQVIHDAALGPSGQSYVSNTQTQLMYHLNSSAMVYQSVKSALNEFLHHLELRNQSLIV